MVQMESVVSGHTFNKIRERLADKLEVVRFDPWRKFLNFLNRISTVFFQFNKRACIGKRRRSEVWIIRKTQLSCCFIYCSIK